MIFWQKSAEKSLAVTFINCAQLNVIMKIQHILHNNIFF